jgi:hypothetical protein
MKAFPVVVLVLLSFAAFFVTFLVAPLAVLMIFYLIYALVTSRPAGAGAPAPATDPQPRWGAIPEEIDSELVAPPARRARITVASHSERAAAAAAAPVAPIAPTPDGDVNAANSTPREP